MNRRRRGDSGSERVLFLFCVVLTCLMALLMTSATYCRDETKELKRQMLKCETCRKVLEQQAIDEALGDLKKEDE